MYMEKMGVSREVAMEKMEALAEKKRKKREKEELHERMKEVPSWAMKEFRKVLKKEKQAHKNSDETVANLTSALNMTTSALKSNAIALKIKAKAHAQALKKKEEIAGNAMKDVAEMKAQVQAANARADQFQNELQGTMSALASERSTSRVLRDRNGGYA